MFKLIPMPKQITYGYGFVSNNAVKIENSNLTERLEIAAQKLPLDEKGIPLKIYFGDKNCENYKIKLDSNEVVIEADSEVGAFYGIQTLRQIFMHNKIPCVSIYDTPDFEYRGFYHDVTRGKVPKIETVKKLIDKMAFYKLNSLQFYVEHSFEFKEYKDIIEETGYLTANEIKEIDRYCYENFIEFIPSLSTFGHLYELLQKEEYKHLCEIENYEPKEIFWYNRMSHHTIDPTKEESFDIIKSLIDQYLPNFSSDKFNICCDETFDLKQGKHKKDNTYELYINFANKIIEYVKSKEKTVMMWADVVLEHPDTIKKLPDDVIFLNWDYDKDPKEENIKTLSKLEKNQIVCPGTNSWSRFSECTQVEEENISLMAKYGKKYGAKGILNTNWGDWGNPASLELSMYGLVIGAEKSWNVETKINEEFKNKVNFLLYKNQNGVKYLTKLSGLQKLKGWEVFAKYYSNLIYENKFDIKIPTFEKVLFIQKECQKLIESLEKERWGNDEYRQEMIIAAKAVCLMAEILGKHEGYNIISQIDTMKWLEDYREKWTWKNKESELSKIEKVFKYLM